MRNINKINYILVFLLMSLGANAQQVNTTKTSLKKETKKKVVGRKSSKDNKQKALSQGYSASEALLMGSTKWTFVASQSFARGFDEFTDAIFSTTSLDMSYKLNSYSALSLSTGYSTIAKNYDGKLFSNYDTDPDRFGLNDTSIGLSIPRIWSNKSMYLNYFGSLTAPTSRTSQRATMVGSMAHGLTLRYRPMSKLLVFGSSSLLATWHRKDTADVFGTQINSPIGLSYALGASYTLTRKLITSASYSQFQRWDHENNLDTIQTARVSLNYIYNSHANIFAGYRFRDLVITNDQLFDDDKSLAFMGVSYAF